MSKGARKGQVNKKDNIQIIKQLGIMAAMTMPGYQENTGKFTAKANRELNKKWIY